MLTTSKIIRSLVFLSFVLFLVKCGSDNKNKTQTSSINLDEYNIPIGWDGKEDWNSPTWEVTTP